MLQYAAVRVMQYRDTDSRMRVRDTEIQTKNIFRENLFSPCFMTFQAKLVLGYRDTDRDTDRYRQRYRQRYRDTGDAHAYRYRQRYRDTDRTLTVTVYCHTAPPQGKRNSKSKRKSLGRREER